MSAPRNAGSQASAPINVLLLLKEHLPNRFREVCDELERNRKRERELLAELAELQQHAAIAKIPVDSSAPLPFATPVVSIVEPQKSDEAAA